MKLVVTIIIEDSMNSELIDKAIMIPGMTWPRELHALAALFQHSEYHIEVGSFCGRSAYATAAGMHRTTQTKRLYLVDDISLIPLVPSQEWCYQVLNNTIREINSTFNVECLLIKETSQQAAIELSVGRHKPTSIFIDAHHSQEDVSQDISRWWSLLQNGCIMAGHDYGAEFPSVMNAVNNAFEDKFNLHSDTRIWWVFKNKETNNLIDKFRSTI